jgi:hypothetical protein
LKSRGKSAPRLKRKHVTRDARQQEKPAQKKQARDPFRRAEERRTVLRFVIGCLLVIGVLAAVVRYGVLGFPYPWKAIDPASSRFSPAAFRFSDYHTPRQFDYAMHRLFPPGTPRAEVERVLRDAGGAEQKLFASTASMRSYAFRYREERAFLLDIIAWLVTTSDRGYSWYVLVKFDGADRVVDVSCTVDAYEEGGRGSYQNISPINRPLE